MFPVSLSLFFFPLLCLSFLLSLPLYLSSPSICRCLSVSVCLSFSLPLYLSVSLSLSQHGYLHFHSECFSSWHYVSMLMPVRGYFIRLLPSISLFLSSPIPLHLSNPSLNEILQEIPSLRIIVAEKLKHLLL